MEVKLVSKVIQSCVFVALTVVLWCQPLESLSHVSAAVNLSTKSMEMERDMESDVNLPADLHEKDSPVRMGKISIEGRFTDQDLIASIGVDCCGTSRKYMDLVAAQKKGFDSSRTLHDKETITLELPVGEHELFAFDEKNLSGISLVHVEEQTTQLIVCKSKLEINNLDPTYPKYRYEFSNVSNGIGLVQVHAKMGAFAGPVEVSIGEKWYKDCHPCKPNVKGAFRGGWDNFCVLKNGENKTFEVPVGWQTIAVRGGDFTSGENLNIEVKRDTVRRVDCVINLDLLERTLYPVTFLFEGGRSKPYFRLVQKN